MAKKIKCNDCHEYHGGFHLCVGHWEPKTGVVIPYSKHLADKVAGIQQRRWQETAERDAKILKMYNDGHVVADIIKETHVSRQTIREVVKRMGGTIRPKSWQPEGWEPANKKEKVNG